MTEREKMVSGELYDSTDKELEQLHLNARKLARKYNLNFTCLDVCEIHIGDNVMIGPNVTLATPMHPFLPEERNIRKREDGSFYNLDMRNQLL